MGKRGAKKLSTRSQRKSCDRTRNWIASSGVFIQCFNHKTCLHLCVFLLFNQLRRRKMQIDLIKGESKFLISGWIVLWLWKFWGKERASICNSSSLDRCIFIYTAVQKLYLYILWHLILALEQIWCWVTKRCHFLACRIILLLAKNRSCFFPQTWFLPFKCLSELFYTQWSKSSKGFIILMVASSDWIFQS